jgi:Domain of unknown function (DUF3291)
VTAQFHLAQLNVATILAPLDDERMRGFVEALDHVNAIADASPGFVWRLKDDAGNATALRPFGADMIVNMSVWESADALFDYVYRSGHKAYLARRKEWFAMPAEMHLVLWWIPAGTIPTVEEAKRRLDLLRANGPSPEAFTFKQRFPASAAAAAADPVY